MTHPLVHDLAGFSIEQITIAHGVITVLAQSQTTSGRCPDCAWVYKYFGTGGYMEP